MKRRTLINIFVYCCLFISGIVVGNLITGNSTIDTTKDELIDKQREFIDTLCNYLYTDYECDVYMDSELLNDIHRLENKLNKYGK